MIVSMTGFSSRTLSIPGKGPSVTVHVTMTLKSLNSRFFELNCKVPFALTSMETELLKYFKSRLHRGNVYFTIHMSNPNALNATISPARPVIAGYISAIDQIKTEFSISGNISIHDLITLPHVFDTLESPINQETLDLLMKAAGELTDDLIKVRQQEGRSLAQDLLGRIKNIKSSLALIEPRSHEVLAARKAELIKNLNDLTPAHLQQSVQDSQQLLIFNQLERLDIHEEITRFKTHTDALEKLLAASDIEKGKKIDFILQELFRETNTISSKCNDSIIGSAAINIKVELEKAREQAQNIV